MAIHPPERIWWKPLGPHERLWVTVSLSFVILISINMPFWQTLGNQELPENTYRTTTTAYSEVVNGFITKYKVGEENGLPIVAPPPGDAFLLGRQWQWTPILKLVKGRTYNIHLSSIDLNHGFSLQPVNINFQVVPGYDQVVVLKPTKAGDYTIVCNEYCGVGHQSMIGKIIVVDQAEK